MHCGIARAIEICQGVANSFKAVVDNATRRFPKLNNVKGSMEKVWKKYNLESYPEFPLSCLGDCVDDVDDDEVVVEDEEENDTVAHDDAEEVVAEQAAQRTKPFAKFVNSFIVLNSSSSLNYIFSPLITLPVPYKEDGAYSDCSLLPLRNSGSSARPEDYDI